MRADDTAAQGIQRMTKPKLRRWQFLNSLILHRDYKSYLEIGVRDGRCFNQIQCEQKHGVDPAPQEGIEVELPYAVMHAMTSEAFFEDNLNGFWDLIFIDGLHHSVQVIRDALNALQRLNPGGTVVLHDCNPKMMEHTLTPIPKHLVGKTWNGDCWKALVWLRTHRKDLEVRTLDADEGLGVIRPDPRFLFEPAEFKWGMLETFREPMLGLVPVSKMEELL